MDNTQQKTNSSIIVNKQPPEQNPKEVSLSGNKTYFWYKDRATLIALISGFFSTLVTTLNVLLR